MNATPPGPSKGQSVAARPCPSLGQSEALPQVAALCWRRLGDAVEVLLITSRETGRWVIPKGWPMTGRSAAEAAGREAWQEAGVRGQVQTLPLGNYLYDKVMVPPEVLLCSVSVYALEVAAIKDRFPEADQRQRSWFDPITAAGLVAEPGLRDLLTSIAEQPESLTGPVR